MTDSHDISQIKIQYQAAVEHGLAARDHCIRVAYLEAASLIAERIAQIEEASAQHSMIAPRVLQLGP